MHMRFLHYPSPGGLLAPHIDLARHHPDDPTRRSSHTFLLYLSDCGSGGETALLERIPDPALGPAGGLSVTIAAVTPRRGRLLLFPHVCPHEGRPVVQAPKLFLRGELY